MIQGQGPGSVGKISLACLRLKVPDLAWKKSWHSDTHLFSCTGGVEGWRFNVIFVCMEREFKASLGSTLEELKSRRAALTGRCQHLATTVHITAS